MFTRVGEAQRNPFTLSRSLPPAAISRCWADQRCVIGRAGFHSALGALLFAPFADSLHPERVRVVKHQTEQVLNFQLRFHLSLDAEKVALDAEPSPKSCVISTVSQRACI